MEKFGDEITVQQGEEWNIDILVSQSSTEYIPFIVSSKRNNPMVALTVASTKYEKRLRYVSTWWLDLVLGDGYDIGGVVQTLPRFIQTVPQYLGEIATGDEPIKPSGDLEMEYLYQFTKEEDEIDVKLGHKPYYYVYFSGNQAKYDYEFRLRLQIKSNETVKWNSQNYMYQITLVDTIPMVEHIDNAHTMYPNLEWRDFPNREDSGIEDNDEWLDYKYEWIENNLNELYHFIKNRIPGWFQDDIDVDSPVGKIDIPQIILEPTRLLVNNNLRTLI